MRLISALAVALAACSHVDLPEPVTLARDVVVWPTLKECDVPAFITPEIRIPLNPRTACAIVAINSTLP